MSHPPANLLLVSFDQLRGDWADPLRPVVKLPAMQRLARRSIVAQRCYTSCPQCVPARLSWLTGLAPSQMGVTRNTVAEAPADAPSLFRRIQQQGWYTELIGKTHWTNHRDPTDLRKNQDLIKSLGFDEVLEIAGPKALRHVRCALTDDWEKAGWLERYVEDMHYRYKMDQGRQAWKVRPSVLPDSLYPDLWLIEKALDALKRMPTRKPWLLWISFVGPHEPFDTPKKWSRTRPHPIPEPITEGDWIPQLPENCELFQTFRRWRGKLNNEEIRECRQDYANHLQLLDAQLKRLLEALSKREDANNTAISITADHGEMLGDHNMLYKGTFLEASINVPFIYSPPPNLNDPPETLHQPVGLTDLFITMLNNLMDCGSGQEITRTIKRTNHVCVEFGNELLTIKNNRKICRRLDGEVLWATQTRKDPAEQINQLVANPQLLHQKKSWMNLAETSKREIEKRLKPSWIWRDCSL